MSESSVPVGITSPELISQQVVEALNRLGCISPSVTVQLTQIIGSKGDISMTNGNHNMIGNNFAKAKFGDNTIIQGSNNSQTKGSATDETDVFQQLLREIESKITDEEEKKDALNDAGALEEAVKKSNLERAKGVFKLLNESVRTSAAGLTIAKMIGLI